MEITAPSTHVFTVRLFFFHKELFTSYRTINQPRTSIVTAKEAFKHLPRFKEDEGKNLVSCEAKGNFHVVDGIKSVVY